MTMPLLLLHGFTGGPESWDRVVALLGSARRVVRPALAGHAGGPAAVADFDGVVDALASELRGRGLSGIHGVGYSMGGRLLLGLLRRHRRLFARATVIAAHPGLSSAAERRQRAEHDARWGRLLREQGIEAFVEAWERQPLFATQQRLPPAVLARQRQTRLAHDPFQLALALEGGLGLAQMPDHRPLLHDPPVPTELLVGEDDAKFITLARRLVAQAARVDLSTLENCGHNVPLEQPEPLVRLLNNQ